MSPKGAEFLLDGVLRIAEVESVDEKAKRCGISYPGGIGGARNVVANPSPLLGFLPRVGTLVCVFDKPGHAKRILFPLSETSTSEGRQDSELVEQEDPPGLIPDMKEDTIFIGRNSRALFRANGDVNILSRKKRANVYLRYERSVAEVVGYNFDFMTPERGIRMYTKSSSLTPISATVGDSFIIERNSPIAPLKGNAPNPAQINKTRLEIDKEGDFFLFVGNSGPTAVSGLTLDTLGNIYIGNNNNTSLTLDPESSLELETQMCRLEFNVGGDIFLDGPKADLDMKTGGDINLYNSACELGLEADGDVKLFDSAWKMEMLAAGNATLKNTAGTSKLELTPAGAVTLQATPASSLALLTAGTTTLTGTTKVDVVSAEIILNAALVELGSMATQYVALAQPLKAIMYTIQYFNTLVKSHTHPVFGIVTSGLGIGGTVAGMTTTAPTLNVDPVPPTNPLIELIPSTTVKVKS